MKSVVLLLLLRWYVFGCSFSLNYFFFKYIVCLIKPLNDITCGMLRLEDLSLVMKERERGNGKEIWKVITSRFKGAA